MQNSQFTQKESDFKESRFSQYSKFDFDIKSQAFQVDESINKSIIERCISEKEFSPSTEGGRKLYLNDLQSNKENSQDSRFCTKQNNITTNHNNQPQSYAQSRKIVLQRNPYRNTNVDESFNTNKIVQLQEELLEVRKQLSMKQSAWIKQKSILLNKIQIVQYDFAEIKQRNNNLIQINQTLTQALGETNKQSSTNETDKRIDELTRQITNKNRKIQSLQQTISKIQKQKMDLQLKLKQQREKNQSLLKNIEEYKTILKESNQRKLQSDEKLMVMNKNVDILRVKLKQLPIKESYLHPIFAFLQSMKFINFQSHITEESSYLQISEVKKPQQERSFIGQKNKYRQQQSFVQMRPNYYGNANDNSYIAENSNYYENEQSYAERESEYVDANRNNSYFMKAKKSNSGLNLFSRQVKMIDTDENKDQEQNQDHYEDEEEVYLCEICQRVYPYGQFMGHLQQCQQYEALLKQKRAIESKLISIKEQEYDNRKSSGNSLNNSVILMNKSKSKGKFIKPHEQGHRVDKGYNNRESNSRKISTNNGNKTQRHAHQQVYEGNSRLELSELMNISEISNRHSNINNNGKKTKKNLINPNNYFSNGIQNQQNFNLQYNQENFNYKIKPNPQIKYQTNIPSQQNNIGKESMQEQIRRIVEAMNQGRKSVSKQGGFQKTTHKNIQVDNRSLTSRTTNAQKPERRESQLGGRNYDRSSRNKADFY